MNEQLAAVVCQDVYADAVTLGPFAGVMDGLDLGVSGADVLAQFARSVPTGVQPWSDKEYLLHPGSRSIDNVCGARFRNAIAGVPAVVTASLHGSDSPILGPLTPAAAALGPPLFPAQNVALIGVGAGHFTAFTGAPPDGYSGVAVYVKGGANQAWLSVEPEIFIGGGFNFVPAQQLFIPGGSSPLGRLFVFPVSTNQLTVELLFGTVGDVLEIGVWPTNLAPGSYSVAPATALFLEWPTAALPIGVTTFDLAPFFGSASIVATSNIVAGSMAFTIQTLDSNGVQIAQPLYEITSAPVNGIQQVAQADLWLPIGRNQLQIVNNGANGNTGFVSILGKLAGLS